MPEETLKNMVELNPEGVNMNYEVLQDVDGRILRRIVIDGKVLNYDEAAIVVARADTIIKDAACL